MGGVSGVCLFERPVNVVNRRDVSLVIKVDFAALGIDICGGAIGSDGYKMCVKRVGQCTIAKHRTTPAPFVPKNISSLHVYVLITVSGQNKNQVWLTTLVTIEKWDHVMSNHGRTILVPRQPGWISLHNLNWWTKMTQKLRLLRSKL